MCGAAGSATNFTPRGLRTRPPAAAAKAGLVLAAVQTSLSQLHSLTQALPRGRHRMGRRCHRQAAADGVCDAARRAAQGPPSPLRARCVLSESSVEGVRLQAAWGSNPKPKPNPHPHPNPNPNPTLTLTLTLT